MPKIGVQDWLAASQSILSGDLYRYSSTAHHLDAFEARFAAAMGAKHALALNSGTSALVCALAAAGVGPGDEVLVPAYTWMATAAAAVMVGAVPVLVDIDESLTIDPADIARKITPHTRAIIPVHMMNLPCAMDEIMALAGRHNLFVIEDACQAVGVRYKDKFCGAIGDAGAYSFNAFKNINIGEGGALTTNDERLFVRARNYHDLGAPIRNHDLTSNEPPMIGANMRLTELQGAMLNSQLARLDPMVRELCAKRRIMADALQQAGFRLAPHHTPEHAASLVVIFDTAEEAETFAERPQVMRLLDSSKHVYTNWEAILAKRTFHPKMNPWAWAHREIDYSAESCARSLDILGRSCRVWLGQRYPAPLMRLAAKRLARPL